MSASTAPNTFNNSHAPILVSGATSHTGERVVALLRRSGARVRILTRDLDKPARLGIDLESVEMFRGDLDRPWTLWEALQGCRAMINVAHIRFGSVCARACMALDVRRLLVMSSTRLLTQWPCDTSRAVARGESAVASSPLDWTLFRSSMIYGGPRDNNFTRLVRWIERHRWAPLVAGGQSLIQPVFVDDLADLIVRSVDDPRTFRRRVLVAGPAPVSYRRLMELLARVTDRRIRFINVPAPLALAAAWGLENFAPRLRVKREQVRRLLEDKAFDISATRADLEFSPRSIEDGVKEKIRRLRG